MNDFFASLSLHLQKRVIVPLKPLHLPFLQKEFFQIFYPMPLQLNKPELFFLYRPSRLDKESEL